MTNSMWLLAVLACGASDFAASVSLLPTEKSPVRRQRGEEELAGREVDCVFWGEARPAGHPAGTTRMNAKLFKTPEEAQEFFDISILRGSDIVTYYKGCPCSPGNDLSHPYEHKHYYTPLFNGSINLVEDRTMYTWCKRTNEQHEDVSPDKWKPYSFLVHPPVSKEKKPIQLSSSMKQKLEDNDEDQGPATAYTTGHSDMRCVIAGKTSMDHSNVNATLFANFKDASAYFDKSEGADLLIHYDGKREWKHRLSPKVKHVPWLSFLNWCKDIHTQWKKEPKSILLGQPSEVVAESLIRSSPPPGYVTGQALSMAESETPGLLYAWKSADFAPKTTYTQVQELLEHGMGRQVVSYNRFKNWNCAIENMTGTRLAGTDMTVAACKELCDKDLQCGCLQYDRSSGVCFYANAGTCNEKRCKKSTTTSIYLQRAKWTTDIKKVKQIQGKACAGSGSKVLGVESKVKNGGGDCRHLCASEKECTCFKFNRAENTCTTMKGCDMDQCKDSENDDMYFFEAAYNGYARDHAGQEW